MAELDYDGVADPGEGLNLPSLAQVLNMAGGVISLALIAGLVWWGYNLTVRDISGVPVVRALEGPMRTAPDDPGGELDVHKGLAVNSIPAQGVADEPAETIALAPQPDPLVEEDAPGLGTAVAVEVAEEPAPAVSDVEDSTTAALVEDAPAPAEPAEPQYLSLIDSALAEATGTIIGPNGKEINLVPADVDGVTKSLLPQPRPETLAAFAPRATGEDGVVTLDPSEIPEGTRLAQLGAFDSAAIAMAEWAELSRQFPEYMTPHARVIEEAQSGGKLFFRLRAHGFDGLSDARRFCAALIAGGKNCIPVRQR